MSTQSDKGQVGVIDDNPANIGSKKSEYVHFNVLKPLNILQN